jgi:hypothetical protein
MKPQGEYPCPLCNKKTQHTISLTGDHAQVTCSVCNQVSAKYTASELREKLEKQLQLHNHPPLEIVANVPQIQVFIKHHLGEAEVSPEGLLEHMRITGAAPIVGEKLMALPRGTHHKAFAIPIGEVVRIVDINSNK